MAIVVPDVGEVTLLENIKTSYSNSFHLHLYKNNFTPVEASVLGDFTEADFSGYATQAFGFTTALTVAGISYIVGSPLMWQQNGGGTSNTIYGYYVTDNSNTILLWAERFSSSKSMAGLADLLTVVARVELD
jgi:hypothetical protein